MSGMPTTILMVQHFPAVDDYIVYRAGQQAEIYHGGPAITDSDFYKYVVSCRASGQLCESNFSVSTGRVDGKMVTCKQVIYSTMFTGLNSQPVKEMATAQFGAAVQEAKNALEFLKGGINWVKWCPEMFMLSVNAGLMQRTKTGHLHNLGEAAQEVIEYIQNCYAEGHIALMRHINRPVAVGRAVRITPVTEYYFSMTKTHKDFQGSDAVELSADDIVKLGL